MGNERRAYPDRARTDVGAAIPRRSLLRAWAGGSMGALVSSLLSRRQARGDTPAGGHARRIRSCIVVYYYGGPSHLDTYDLKPRAPAEVRGEFKPIATSVPGRFVCEHLPRMATLMHQVAVVRSFHHPMRNHNAAAVEALCGRTPVKGDLELLANDPTVDFPAYGAAVNRLSPATGNVPAHIALPHVMYNVVVLPGQTAGFLGAAYAPFQVAQDPNVENFQVRELELPAELSAQRLQGRDALLASIDGPSGAAMDAARTMETNRRRALDLIRSDEVRGAFNLGLEDGAARDRYGRHTLGQSLLLARRLVEAGVQFINVNDKVHNGQLANWDSHQDNFPRLKNDLLPLADQAFSALLEDLHARGLLETTLVVALSEFGRTPRINNSGGRDHWPDCYSILLAGGGVVGGSAHGTSDKLGAYPDLDPVRPGDLAATIFSAFGIDPATEFADSLGRPYRVAQGQPIRAIL